MSLHLVTIITVLALIEYLVFGIQVGRARGRYKVDAPATTGHPIFERHFRVHQNTLEQLCVFVPALWLFAFYVSQGAAVGLGLVYLAARVIYARGYVEDPAKRSTGAILTAIATSVLLIGALVGAIARAI